MKEKQIYAAPEVEVVKVKVEKGFLGTSTQSVKAAKFSSWSDENSWE